jgi:pimeloyl-ACP methyl ester carboxylesterase
MSFWYSVGKWISYITISIIASLLGFLYMNQTRFIYPSDFPLESRQKVSTPQEFGLQGESIYISYDNVKLHCYYIPNPKKSNVTLLYFHANAGNMGHRLPIAKKLLQVLDCNVFMLSYRGYGLSTGVANEKGIKLDAQKALDYILEHKLGQRIIVYGQSIGGAVAIDTTNRNQDKIAALIVENTFLSLVNSILILVSIDSICNASFGIYKIFLSSKMEFQ